MTITTKQLDELERKANESQRAAAHAAFKGIALPFAQSEDARSADVTLQLVAVYRAALALVSQPMLTKGDAATWGDVAQSHSDGPRLLSNLMRAVNGDAT